MSAGVKILLLGARIENRSRNGYTVDRFVRVRISARSEIVSQKRGKIRMLDAEIWPLQSSWQQGNPTSSLQRQQAIHLGSSVEKNVRRIEVRNLNAIGVELTRESLHIPSDVDEKVVAPAGNEQIIPVAYHVHTIAEIQKRRGNLQRLPVVRVFVRQGLAGWQQKGINQVG